MANDLGKDLLMDMLGRMLLIRRFEERAGQQYTLGKVGGFCHLYIGQEAVAVGALSALDPEDYVVDGYREHGHALARGVAPGRVMAELFGKATGLSKGKGGSMHIFDREHRFLGGYGIVGGQIPLGAGVAFALKYRGEQKVCACFFGDAAVNQGGFHETLNMASLWKLPVLFIVENNRYGMGTPLELSSAVTELCQRSGAYGVPGEAVDGMDCIAVYQAIRGLAERARRGGGPSFLEARTYRYRGHSMADAATYRAKDEVEQMKKQDPILRLREHLLHYQMATEAELEALDEKAKTEALAAVKFADESPEPEDDSLFADVVA